MRIGAEVREGWFSSGATATKSAGGRVRSAAWNAPCAAPAAIGMFKPVVDEFGFLPAYLHRGRRWIGEELLNELMKCFP
jgi:hypothetical protein